MIECAEWVARDVAEQELNAEVEVLSVHPRVINLTVEGQKSLLMLAHPELPRGPACAGLSETLFTKCRALLQPGCTGRIEAGTYYLGAREGSLAITWGGCPTVSFAPPPRPERDPERIRQAAAGYRERLAALEAPSAAGALLCFSGPDPYFQERILEFFPTLVTALLTNNKQDFKCSCRKLIGMGRGATPTGDDLIFGALAAAAYLSVEQIPDLPAGVAEKTTRMGVHMLEMGRRGLAPEPVTRFLLSILAGRAQAALLDNLLQVGSATGYEIATAILYTVKQAAAQ